ncbi:MAG: flavodoxin family protein [Solobacterium sp.]|nr:flavodoxin family protein [Solobacterium sp.]
MKNVLLINGSVRPNGTTAGSLKSMEQYLTEHEIGCSWFQLKPVPQRGCISCSSCKETHRCQFNDDQCNELIEKILEADAVVIGSPVYFAGPNGLLCALLDRAFFAASNYGELFRGKAGAAVVSSWREGGTAALDRLNKYFTFAEMNIISSNYWNSVLNRNDSYGEAVIQRLSENLV